MIRKLRNLIISFLLLVSTTGFSVSTHFCGTRLVSIDVNNEAEPCCDSGMCCHTEMYFYQLDEDFVASAISFDSEPTCMTELNFIELFTLTHLFKAEADNHFFSIAESPPPLNRDTRLSTLQKYIL